MNDYFFLTFFLTKRMPLRTEMPLMFSTERSTREAMTMIKSKIFQPLSKYTLLHANSFNTASAVKNVVKT